MEIVQDINTVGDEADTDEMKGKYLTFWTDNQLFGVPISDVVQIIGIQEITPVPDSPLYAKGVINLRGSIIPVIDVRLRFKKAEEKYNERTCIIVTKIDESYIGFIVDSVDEVTTISDEDISSPPKVSNDHTNAYLTGIGKVENKVVLLLDTSKILNESEFELVKDAVTGINK
jgi:purine-binding chemotaxis protein CheW